MIEYIKRKDLDTNKYDACIENSIQSRIYAFSWYLDIVADNWDVLVLNDYEAVMPIPWRKKFFIKYVYTPLRVLELGVFSFNKVDLEVFSNMLCKKFFYANLRFNSENRLINFSEVLTEKQQQYVLLKDDYEIILDNYRKDRKKDLNKAKKAGLTEEWNDSVENLIHLFKNNVGKRFKGMSVNDYQIMEEIVKRCIDEKKGQVLSIYDKDKRLVSSGFFIKNNKKISILFSSTDFQNRRNGANSFLIDRAIFKYQEDNDMFSFGGSSIESIAKYFKSFGAETANYYHLGYNNLPIFLKLFKK